MKAAYESLLLQTASRSRYKQLFVSAACRKHRCCQSTLLCFPPGAFSCVSAELRVVCHLASGNRSGECLSAWPLTFHSSSHSLSSSAFLWRRTSAFTSVWTTLAFISTCSAMAWTFSMLSCGDRTQRCCVSTLRRPWKQPWKQSQQTASGGGVLVLKNKMGTFLTASVPGHSNVSAGNEKLPQD